MGILGLVIVQVFFCAFTIALTADNCYTPDQRQGACKLITECAPLHAILLNRSMSATSLEFLKKSQCGFTGKTPLVCCPNNDSVVENVVDDVLDRTGPINNQECGTFTEDRIFNGDSTDLGQYPWNALLKYETIDGQSGFYCGGSIISDKYILTAAHCIKGVDLPENTTLVSVRLGEHNTQTNPDCVSYYEEYEDCAEPFSDVPVDLTIVHEDYNPVDPNQYHDIALIKLKSKLSFNDFIVPVCLPTSLEELKANYTDLRLTVAGWGINKNKPTSAAKIKGYVYGAKMSDCTPIFDSVGIKLGQEQICTRREQPQNNNCVDDSGGSLLAFSRVNFKYYAAGVMSFEHMSCYAEKHLGVYTKVDQYVKWIMSKIKP